MAIEIDKTSEGNIWEIHRLELCHLNPRHRRWQILQESPASEQHSFNPDVQILHRRQIQQLLGTVRLYLNSVVRDTYLTVGSVSKSANIPLTIDPQDPLLQPILQDGKQVWENLLGYLEQTAEFQMIPTLNEIKAKLLDKIKTLQAPYTTSLTMDEALDLLSILPWLPEWDTPGCWWRALQTASQTGIVFSEDVFPPTGDPGLWRESCYLARLHYEDALCQKGKAPLSQTILGYPVKFESLYQDPRVPYSTPLHSPPADFYAEGRCRNPDDPDPSRTNESSLYRFWAFFMDAIQKQIEGGSGQTDHAIVNLFAYPVFSPTGWSFLHLYVRYTGGGKQPSIRRLWNDWRPIHDGLMQHSFRLFLIETLDRIELTYFQARLKSEVIKGCLNSGKLTDHQLVALLCKEIYTLLPARRLAGGARTYSGRKYYWPEPRDPNADDPNRVFVGWKWGEEAGDPPKEPAHADHTVKLLDDTEVKIWLENAPPTETNLALTAGRVTQYIEQQFQIGKLSTEALRSMMQEIKENKIQEWNTRYPQLVAQASQILTTVRRAETGWRAKFDGLTFMLDGKGLEAEEFFRPYFYSHSLDANTEPAWEAAYRLLITANGHSVISHFVETGVVYWLTHGDTEEDITQVMQSFRSSWSAVQAVLNQDNHRDTPHAICLTCMRDLIVEHILPKEVSGRTVSPRSLEQRVPSGMRVECVTCKKHGQNVPAWFTGSCEQWGATVATNLVQLHDRRDYAFRVPWDGSDEQQIRLMLGLVPNDRLYLEENSEPFIISFALAGLPKWVDALNGFRGRRKDGQLEVFLLSRKTPIENRPKGGFFPAIDYCTNYLAICRTLTPNKDAEQPQRVDRIKSFRSVIEGVGIGYYSTFWKKDGSVSQRSMVSLLGLGDKTPMVYECNDIEIGFEFRDLPDGCWQAIVIGLDRVKR